MLKWNCTPDVVSYNAIIDIICKGGLLDQALYLFSGMLRDLNVVPDVVAYNILIKEFGNLGRIKEANKLFDEMKDSYHLTYGTIFDGLCKNGEIKEAIELFESMEGTSISANIGIYSMKYNLLIQVGKLEDSR
ncbi:pentatricopeptide repeat-containing protein At3g22470, mitochondrial-like [Papaver somniferum]|uniref:pentatricopeptide repeat-containing protein At3g22470, mitochondrial-like n=1 Tax=Papaver somniferum TaxID=3469 RepID=UPI000E6F6BF6|nr:pentatricopeptide repeat-containing protein At3g22470, mitochondrial-like [Papaver somniferum]